MHELVAPTMAGWWQQMASALIYPVVIFDTDFYPYFFTTERALENWLEPLVVEELLNGFDFAARPVEIYLKESRLLARASVEGQNEQLLKQQSVTSLSKFGKNTFLPAARIQEMDLKLLFDMLKNI